MWAFLSELLSDPGRPRTVLLVDEDSVDPPASYQIRPLQVAGLWGGSALALALVVAALMAFTPLRKIIPGYATAEVHQRAQMNALRVEALQDSLQRQHQYMAQLRQLMTGRMDSVTLAESNLAAPEGAVSNELADVAADPSSESWREHGQPALSVAHLSVPGEASRPQDGRSRDSPANLQFPVQPPVEGFVTRGFDARTGHYAVDLAVKEGSPVRAIGDGYVIMADWTQEGGFAIAVQHTGGYVSVYKHNKRLLKRVGDRVREREVIARSGNSGEITTGPHLHVELWHHGLAQDPRQYFVGG